MKLPANKDLKQRARDLRNNSTLSEVLLWQMIKNKRVYGLDFDRQKIIGNYIVDFYCPKLNLVIEIDGSSHDNKYTYDAKRDKYLKGLGLVVLHIEDRDVKLNMSKVLDMIDAFIKTTTPTFHVTPSPAKGIK